MTSTTDIDAIRTKWLNQCGPCDAGLPMECSHPTDDYRPVMAALLAKVDELTAERDDLAAYNRAVKGANANLRAALAEKDAQLTAANRRNDGLQADLDSATKANTAWANHTAELKKVRAQLTAATGTPVCNCCFVDGSTQRCGRPATAIVDVPPFGFLDVAETCRSRINGEPAGEPERPAGAAR